MQHWILFLSIVILSGCFKKLEEEELRHIQPLRKRLYGEWEMYKFEINGIDSSSYLSIDTMKIYKFWKFDRESKDRKYRFTVRSKEESEWHYLMMTSYTRRGNLDYSIPDLYIADERHELGGEDVIGYFGFEYSDKINGDYSINQLKPNFVEFTRIGQLFNYWQIGPDNSFILYEVLKCNKEELKMRGTVFSQDSLGNNYKNVYTMYFKKLK